MAAAATAGGGIGTVSVHGGRDPDQWKCKAMWPPIISSTTYKQSVIESRLEEQESISGQYTYSRSNNPTRECLEKSLACLEGAEYGFVTNSGSTATVVTLQSLLRPGDNILTAENVYFGSNILMEKLFSDYKITTTFFNVLKADDKALESAITENTKLIWVDTPCNPTIELFDIQKLSAVAHKKSEDCLLVIDSTFATPYFIRPLSLGADVVIHSATKFLNGHGDVLMGVICTNSATIAGSIRTLLTSTGTIPSPFDCYLANRGLHTLHVRMKVHAENALAVAHYLESSPFVDSVSYPGLPSHPQHELAKKMFSNNGFGSMVSFKIKGDLETAKKFLTNLKVFTMAVSLGSLESLAEVCTIMTRKAMKREDKLRIGITDNMIRLSVGLEDIDDLLDDLKQALQRCGQPHAIKMRPLTEEETKAVLEKLSKYIGDNVKLLVDRPDGSYVFRLQKSRVFYVKEQIMRWATNVARKQMLSLGTCIGKFTHGGKFHLVITGLDILAPHAKHKVWLKANSEQQFLYGHNVLKGGLGRITENTPMYQGVLVYSMNDTPLGFGVAAKSTQDCRHVDPGTTVIFNQADIGQYLRSEDQLS